ncbi:hypothetical protein Hdeb2414_s0010g00355221 [Helianthus debilis subsp. tardiflorus]
MIFKRKKSALTPNIYFNKTRVKRVIYGIIITYGIKHSVKVYGTKKNLRVNSVKQGNKL